MFSIEFILQMIQPIIGNLLTKPGSAVKYMKWIIRIRNYALLLFPLDVYPVDWTGTTIDADNAEKYQVPVEAAKQAAKKQGFQITFG